MRGSSFPFAMSSQQRLVVLIWWYSLLQLKHVACLEKLLDLGAKVNVHDAAGQPPILTSQVRFF